MSNSQQPAAEITEAAEPSSILFLRGEEQVAAFSNQQQLSLARPVTASSQPLALPSAAEPLGAITIAHDGRTLSLDDYFEQTRTAGVLVLQDGQVLYERYGFDNTADTRWISFSVAKSVVSMLIGAAIQDGYIQSVQDPITDYLPLLRDSSYSEATIADLLQMASGVAWNEDYTDPQSDVASVNYETLALYEQLRNKARVAEPGVVFNYNTAETNLAGTLLRAAIGNNLSTYLEHKIWQPFGMADGAYWQLTEPGGGEFGGCCINATLRDYGRLGLFALNDGRLADGTRVLPEGWMARSVAPSKGDDGYGYFWWLDPAASTYEAMGIFGQSIYINPTKKLVIAVHSAWDEADNDADWALLKAMQTAVANAVD